MTEQRLSICAAIKKTREAAHTSFPASHPRAIFFLFPKSEIKRFRQFTGFLFCFGVDFEALAPISASALVEPALRSAHVATEGLKQSTKCLVRRSETRCRITSPLLNN
jgi:hypothetical protein